MIKKLNPSITKLLSGNFVSLTGDQIYILALPIIVYQQTGSAYVMGIIAAVERVPVFLQPIAGVISDRFDKRRILIVVDFLRFLLISSVGLLYILEYLTVHYLVTAAFLLGVLSQFHHTAQFAIIPRLVKKSSLQSINAVDSGLGNTAILLGPTLGGLIISILNPGVAILLNSISFLFSFLLIISIKHIPQQRIKAKHNKFFQEIKTGFEFVWKVKIIRYTNLTLMFSTFGVTMLLTMLVFFLKSELDFSSTHIGYTLSAGGVFAIAGAIISPILLQRIPILYYLCSVQLIGGISIVLLGLSTSFISVLIWNGVGVLVAAMINPCIRTIRHEHTPEHLIGKVQASSRFLTWCLMPLSAYLAGVIASHIGTNLTIIIAGCITTFSAIIYLFCIVTEINEKRQELAS